MSVAVADVITCNVDRRALDKVLCINASGSRLLFGINESEIALGLVLSDSAMDTRSCKANSSTNSAFDYFYNVVHISISFLFKTEAVTARLARDEIEALDSGT